jgi:hypothetical protein
MNRGVANQGTTRLAPPHRNNQKFFGSFFQKRTASFDAA